MIHDAVIVGAGISGLSLARHMRRQGRAPVVLERARGVGGRCATRRVEGQPVDYGLTFLHGRSGRFLAELAAVSAGTVVPDWPRVREGDGAACRPEAFEARDRRAAMAEGASRFAKHLADGLDVRLRANVSGLRAPAAAGSRGEKAWAVVLESGETLVTRTLALTMPVPSVLALLEGMAPAPRSVVAVLPLLRLVRTLPCLTVIARYLPGVQAPPWEVGLPRASTAIQAVFCDSSKRVGPTRLVLVIQARAGFSRAHLDEPDERWSQLLLREAAVALGGWIARPELVQTHRWKHARVAPGTELAGPLTLDAEEAGVLGLAGDGFHGAGGAEGAYLSGSELAARWSGVAETSSSASERREPCH